MNGKPKSYSQVTLLLVEDDDIDAMGIQRALHKLKIANPLLRARDGLEALEMLRMPGKVIRPYLILLDLNMPRMNGFEMLEALREDEELSNSIVFVLTTSNGDQDKVAAFKHHVAGYIVKRQAADGFMQIIEMLDHYWRIVELPESR